MARYSRATTAMDKDDTPFPTRQMAVLGSLHPNKESPIVINC